MIRDATEADLTAIAELYAHHVLYGRASFEEAPPDVAELAARRLAVLSLGLPYLVAESDGRLGGFAYAGAFRPRAAYRFTVEDSVYVADGMAGRGIGTALLTELIARCGAGPWRQMVASSVTARPRPSRCTPSWASCMRDASRASVSSSALGPTS
ncbi:MAG: N-acetyltransferase [Trueperaceae bacterium]|nr:N-acetyltransferase [Trueperaceae bacterium]MCO5174676.1 N-acetyltransferase family protein [Trueperaceae bacterium]MCW5819425.1 N-acetyltransferase [Trueperaceae bacterium]